MKQHVPQFLCDGITLDELYIGVIDNMVWLRLPYQDICLSYRTRFWEAQTETTIALQDTMFYDETGNKSLEVTCSFLRT